MALTITVSTENPTGGQIGSGERVLRGTITFDTSYPTGGETLDLSNYFDSDSYPTVILNGEGGYEPQHDGGTASAGKILMYEAGADAAPLDEVANTTDLSAVVCPFIAIGKPL